MTIRARVFCGHSNPSSRRDPGWAALMASVYTQAVRDARGGELPQALDAALWLSGPDAPIYLEAVGLDVDPLAILISGRARKLSRI